LDLEVAFAGSEDVMGVIESLIKEVWNNVIPESIDTEAAFRRMTYDEAMRKVSSQSFISRSTEAINLIYGMGWHS
jgi:aspartyl-tRNA synthetase